MRYNESSHADSVDSLDSFIPFIALSLYYPLFLAGIIDGIQCPHRAEEVVADWPTLLCPSIEAYFRTSTQLFQKCTTCLTHLGWFVRWEMQLAERLLFCRVLLLGFIQSDIHHLCTGLISLFLQELSQSPIRHSGKGINSCHSHNGKLF